ncbi:Acetate kinase [hydrothermal vent metagenome]|uniref:Acetate kinase n=1 Tax=hydrothermal vent metagenome TaxID=652676 RepID=A0A1W1CBH1_9ZZZZ
MKKILIFNAGSSSIKCQYFIGELSVASILIEEIGSKKGTNCTLWYANSQDTHKIYISNYTEAINEIVSMLMHSGVLPSIVDIDGIGHRVVHGGVDFISPTIITNRVIKSLEKLIPLAPLHNKANIEGIKIMNKQYPNIRQVAIFDTAFHSKIPYYAYLYAIPYNLYEDFNIRKYGFHGISHSFVSKECANLLETKIENMNIISIHLGSGASISAIRGGYSIDTSMGMTPLDGLIMGTRCGEIDPAIGLYISTETGKTIEEINDIYNNDSGLKGICGESDMRDIINSANIKGDRLCNIALDMYIYRIKKFIGSYAVALGRLDAIIFTGGVGENSSVIREMVCEGLGSLLGIVIDNEKNSIKNQKIINKDNSKVKICVIPTNEELSMARDVSKLLN